MGIQKAQAALLAEGTLNGLGSQRVNSELSTVEAILSEAAKAFIQSATDTLQKTGSVATGELLTSLTFDLEQNGSRYQVTIGYPKDTKAAKYFDFINKGVKGTEGGSGAYQFKSPYPSRKMALAIQAWRKLSGRQSRNVNTSVSQLETKRKSVAEAPTSLSIAYATATNIKKHGIKPTHFFDKATQETFNDQLKEALQVALGADIKFQIQNL